MKLLLNWSDVVTSTSSPRSVPTAVVESDLQRCHQALAFSLRSESGDRDVSNDW